MSNAPGDARAPSSSDGSSDGKALAECSGLLYTGMELELDSVSMLGDGEDGTGKIENGYKLESSSVVGEGARISTFRFVTTTLVGIVDARLVVELFAR